MSTYLPLLIFLAVVAVLAAGSIIIWLQRSPRRAALATLRLATPLPRTAAPPRPGTAPAGPARTDRSLEETPALKLAEDAAIAAVARISASAEPPAYSASVRRRLSLAGKDRQTDADRFLAFRVLFSLWWSRYSS